MCQFGEMCECEYVCEERGLHGETGAKLDSETSQIACEMKHTNQGKKTKKNQQQHKAQEKCQARQAGTKAKNRNKTKQTHFSFCSTYFRLQMTKTTLKELEESKSNRQVCLAVS